MTNYIAFTIVLQNMKAIAPTIPEELRSQGTIIMKMHENVKVP
jgi:hypothetical protein